MEYLDKHKKELFELGDSLFKNPELGYKEYKTKAILKDFFKKHHLEVKELGYETAFSVSIGKGKPHIGLIAELDAVPTLGHKYANKKDNNAAHSCGHFVQCANMAMALVSLNECGIKNGKVTLFFTPAEEYTDIEYRKKLMKQKKIKYIGGKTNMLVGGVFDDVDMFIHLHAMNKGEYDYSLGSSLSGFIYKKITFLGKASHAATAREKGIDALDEFNDFYNEIRVIRDSFKKEDYTTIHGIVTEGGQSVNVVPSRVIYECYVRSNDANKLIELNKKVNKLARSVCKKYGGKVKIEDYPGYLPLHQSKELNEVIKEEINKYTNNVKENHTSMAAGDTGDLGSFKPLIQFGHAGFSGTCHSKEFCIVDVDKAYIEPIKIIVGSVKKLLNDDVLVKKIKKSYKKSISFEEYIKYLNS